LGDHAIVGSVGHVNTIPYPRQTRILAPLRFRFFLRLKDGMIEPVFESESIVADGET